MDNWKEKTAALSTSTIKNYIWAAIDNDQPVPGCIPVEALREELKHRGEKPRGYHNT